MEGAIVSGDSQNLEAIGLSSDQLPLIKEKVKEEEAQCQSLLSS